MIPIMDGALEGAARVFAGEFSRSTESVTVPSGDNIPRVLTPTGAACGRILVAGALTEMSDTGSLIRCRLADPTGVFTIELNGSASGNGKSELSDAMKRVPVPSFLVVVGRAQIRSGNVAAPAVIRPESVQIVSRAVRDAWVVRTAESTLDRLSSMADALSGNDADPVVVAAISRYAMTWAGLREIVAMVESALAGVAPAPASTPADAGPGAAAPDAKEVLTAILTELQGPRGMEVAELVAQAVLRGVPKERAEEGIAEMIREDDCYQPQKGSVKLL